MRRACYIIGIVLLVLSALLTRAEADQYIFEDPPEPTTQELFAAAGLDAADPDALVTWLNRQRRHDSLADVWIAHAHEREQRLLVEAMFMPQGQREPTRKPLRPVQVQEKLIADLRASRRADPARQADAVLRQMGRIGRAQDISVLIDHSQAARTVWGRWKYLVAVQEIAARVPPDLVQLSVNEAAPLLRDLPPEKAGALAERYLALAAEWERHPNVPTRLKLPTRFWLAWALSDRDPAAALAQFKIVLDSRDPAMRLAAGMGIARLSDGDGIPFRLTDPPEVIEPARRQWLAGLTPRPPEQFHFRSPFALPLIKRQRGGRADLIWVDASGAEVRSETDVWPHVRAVLPDGTLYAQEPRFGDGAALLTRDGGPITRFEQDPQGTAAYTGATMADHGGVWVSSARGDVAEYAPWGELLWALPVRAIQPRILPGRRGHMLLLGRRGVELVDRRGDTVWSNAAGGRWAVLTGPDEILITQQNNIELMRMDGTVLKRVSGMTSLDEVRYHPTKPWLLIDAVDLKILDPATDRVQTRRWHWDNDDPTLPSKWIRPGAQWAE